MAETGSRLPAFASDAWMLEQQMRAEVEAEGWRRLREELRPIAPPPQLQPQPSQAVQAKEPFRFGAAIFKGLVRFGIGAFGGYLGYIAALDGGLGEFEAWLAVLAGFVVSLALTAFGPGRRFVALMADAARWALIIAAGIGAVYLMTQMSA